ncbi:MAG TPA: chromate transporter [Ohtaekwangia sp.]|nr:chromate transporter [Ohtaekwangia sp.]
MPLPYTLRDLVFYFLKLGTWGFGGPVALVGYMHRDLVDNKQWISEEAYREGMALAQLAPGPLAAQLSIYIGYVHYGLIGATLAGLAFVIPSFLMVLGLGYAYTVYGGLPWMQAIFFGVSASVIGIIGVSSYKLSSRSIGKDKLLWGIFIVLAISTWLTASESIWLMLAGGVVAWLLKAPPKNIFPALFTAPVVMAVTTAAFVTPTGKLWQIAWFFTKAGAFVFGSGLAIVPFLYGGVVREFGWLTEQQFVDAVAVAMITPGPVVITVGFIGYLTAGFAGACVASLATFLPCYLFTVIPAPYFKKHGKNPAIKAFVDGVTAAAIGAIAGAVCVLAKRTLTDVPSIVFAAITVLLLIRFKKLPEPLIILAAAMTGVAFRMIVAEF